MTNEEWRAVATFELRQIGLHPDWVPRLIEYHGAEQMIKSVKDLERICEADHPWCKPYDKAVDIFVRTN